MSTSGEYVKCLHSQPDIFPVEKLCEIAHWRKKGAHYDLYYPAGLCVRTGMSRCEEHRGAELEPRMGSYGLLLSQPASGEFRARRALALGAGGHSDRLNLRLLCICTHTPLQTTRALTLIVFQDAELCGLAVAAELDF